MNTNDSAKTIVCYGDSNTWGSVPRSSEIQKKTRYPRSIRWTGVLQNLLGNDYDIISEGVSGRTFVAVDRENPWRTGITHLKSILKTSSPIDLMLIMLGTNDVKTRLGLEPEDIAEHLQQTIDLIRTEDIKKILIVCPADIITPESGIEDPRYVGGSDKIKRLPKLFKEIAQKNGCSFVNAGEYIVSSKIDGFHLDADMHRKLAEILKTEILRMFA